MNVHKTLLFSSVLTLSLLQGFNCIAMQPTDQEVIAKQKYDLAELQEQLKTAQETAQKSEQLSIARVAQLADDFKKAQADATEKEQQRDTLAQEKIRLEAERTKLANDLKEASTARDTEKSKKQDAKKNRVTVHATNNYTDSPKGTSDSTNAYNNAQADSIRYGNSWTKLGIDTLAGGGTHILAPLVVHQGDVIFTEWRKKYILETLHEQANTRMLASNEKNAALDIELKELTKKRSESAQKHEEKLAEMEEQTKLVNQFRLQCDGRDNSICQQIGDMSAAIQLRQWEEIHKKVTGKPFVPAKK